METDYAQALWDVIQKGAAPKDAVESLKESLEAHGRLALTSRIARAFERIATRDRQRNGVTLLIARERDERTAKHAAHAILEDMGVKPSDVTVAIDDSLIGGWRLEGRERLVDGSYKKYLSEMYNRATRA